MNIAFLQELATVTVGYARVSTYEQDTASHRSDLKEAGCLVVYQDIASGADRKRPELARCLQSMKKGDTLLVARLDRIARSLSHLLEIVEDLSARGISFRSLADPFDTSSAQGRLHMAMLGAFAEFERHLIRDRTMAGLSIAKAKGKKAGNPKFRERDPVAIGLMRASQADTYLSRVRAGAAPWIETVRRMRPNATWERVAAYINARRLTDKPVSARLLQQHSRKLVGAGDLEPMVLDRAPNPVASAATTSARDALAGIREQNPDASLRALAVLLAEAGFHPKRAKTWSPGSVKALLDNPTGLGCGSVPLKEKP